jgi:hypothetical protein
LSALGLSDIEKIRHDGYDGYVGHSLVEALNKGYMETRYPIPVPVDLSDMRAQFEERFAHLESLPRFSGLFWEARCRG